MDIRRIIREEMDDFEWIKDVDWEYVYIWDLKKGMKVEPDCTGTPFGDFNISKGEYTVTDIYDSYRDGDICVTLVNHNKTQYPFGGGMGFSPSLNVCQHIGCRFKVKKR